MISRRRFLELGGVAGVAATSRPLLAVAGSREPANHSLPPSVARLKSRKNEANPITREERQGRQERARQLMRENGLNAIVLMEGTSLTYFSGIRWWGGERLLRWCCQPKKRRSMCVQHLKKAGPESRSRTRRTANIQTCASGRKTKTPMSALPRD